MKIYRFLSVFCLVIVNHLVASSDDLSLIYRVAGKEYLITEFKDGVPHLNDEALALDLALKGEEGVAWNWSGEFPVDLEYAFPISDYRIRVEPKRYGETSRGATVSLDLYQKNESVPWSKKEIKDSFFVYGWVVDGDVSKIVVSHEASRRNYDGSLHFELEPHEKGGFLLLWLVKAGRLISKPSIAPYEVFALPTETVPDFSKAKIKEKSKQGNTALHYAALNGNVKGVEWLLGNKANAKTTNEYGEIPLMLAAKAGRVEVASLLFTPSVAYEIRSAALLTGLEIAVVQGHFDVVEVLAPSEAKKKSTKNTYRDAVVSAVRNGYETIAVYLMEKKAEVVLNDPSKVDQFLFGLYANRFPDLARMMVNYFEGESLYQRDGTTVMHAVASYGDLELLTEIKDLGVSVNARNEKGVTPLDMAIAFGNVEAICWFMDNGGDLGEGTGGVDPVHRAVGLSQNDSLQCLISYGYNVNTSNRVGFTPLMHSVFVGDMEIADTLVEAGGAWLPEHQHFDACVAKIIERDADFLLLSLDAQGWSLTTKLFETWTLRDVAEFYGSQKTLEFLERKDLEFEDTTFYSGSELDQNLNVLELGAIAFSDEMQRKYGSVDLVIEVLADAQGVVRFVQFEDSVPDDLKSVVSHGVETGSYEPAEIAGKAVASRFVFKLPLKVNLRNEIVFEMSALELNPEPILQIKPRYPYPMKEKSIYGWVNVEFVILSNGSVAHVKAVRYTHSAFVEPTISSIKKSKWKAGEIDGKPVNTRVRQRIRFNP